MAVKTGILTEGQANVLKHMAEDTICLMKQEARAYVAGFGNVNLLTFRALLDKGFISLAESDLTTADFHLTQAGADALRQYENENGEGCGHCTNSK